MERLTGNDNNFFQDGMDEHKVSAVYFKLKAYEDAEEQGLLVRLPCKVGDITYRLGYNCIETMKIRSQSRLGYGAECEDDNKLIYLSYDDFGKTVFLTREKLRKH